MHAARNLKSASALERRQQVPFNLTRHYAYIPPLLSSDGPLASLRYVMTECAYHYTDPISLIEPRLQFILVPASPLSTHPIQTAPRDQSWSRSHRPPNLSSSLLVPIALPLRRLLHFRPPSDLRVVQGRFCCTVELVLSVLLLFAAFNVTLSRLRAIRHGRIFCSRLICVHLPGCFQALMYRAAFPPPPVAQAVPPPGLPPCRCPPCPCFPAAFGITLKGAKPASTLGAVTQVEVDPPPRLPHAKYYAEGPLLVSPTGQLLND